jgi:phage-related protein (TIGR01555 family)
VGVREDGWANTITGQGTSIDPLAQARFSSTRQELAMRPDLAETLYYEDDLIARGIDAIVDDAMRQGFEIERRVSVNDGEEAVDVDTDKALAEAIMRRMRELDASAVVTLGAKLGRLHGGAGIFLGIDGKTDKPATLGGPVRFLTLLERRELTPRTWYDDPTEDGFGEVRTWAITPMGPVQGASSSGVEIHTDRVLKFWGIPVTRIEKRRQSGWSLSVLTRVYDVIRDVQQNWRSVSLILAQAHQPVFKMKGLAQMIANGRDAQVQRRMALVNLSRSASRALVIDADGEDFEYHSAALSGLSDILIQNSQRLAAAWNMPATKLMGISPAGMNATGEGDARNWYDQVQSFREQALTGPLEAIVQAIAAEQGDPTPQEWCIRWPSLWQLDPVAEANYRKTVADTDVAYINAGVLTEAEVTASRFGGEWSAETTVDLEAREAAALAEQQKQTPPPPPPGDVPPMEPAEEAEAESVEPPEAE